MAELPAQGFALTGRWQAAAEQQIERFLKIRLSSEFGDVDSAIKEPAFLAVDKAYARPIHDNIVKSASGGRGLGMAAQV